MKFLLLSFLLVVGLDQILTRFVPSYIYNSYMGMGNAWNEPDYRFYSGYSNSYNDDSLKHLRVDDSSENSKSAEETKETLISSTNSNSDEIVDLFDVLLGSILLNSEEGTTDNADRYYHNNQPSSFSNKNVKSSEEDWTSFLEGKTSDENSDEINTRKVVQEETKSSEEKNDGTDIDISNQDIDELAALLITLSAIDFTDRNPENINENTEDDELESKEGDETSKLLDNKSSEENWTSFSKEDKSKENSDEVPTIKNEEVEADALAKSSEEKRDITAVNYFRADDQGFTALLVNLGDIGLANAYLEHIYDVNDDEKKAKEADNDLNSFNGYLNELLEGKLTVKENNSDNDEDDNDNDKDNNDNDEDDNDNDDDETQNTSSEENSSNEDRTTTAKIDSDEGDNDDSSNYNYDNTVDNDKSDSNERESNTISLTFHGLDDTAQEKNLNDHKYEIVATTAKLQPTSAPHMPESTSLSTSDDNYVIYEYNGIRDDLDAQETTLLENQRSLDKDFYSVISSNYNDESINKFQKDIIVVHENLDRIKRNINAMENLQTKMYFHKLISSVVKEVQNKSNK